MTFLGLLAALRLLIELRASLSRKAVSWQRLLLLLQFKQYNDAHVLSAATAV